MANSKDHPVWSVYDLYRETRLNVKYYSTKLSRLNKFNLALELIIAIAAPSSAIAALWFWDNDIGEVVWKYFGVIAAVAAILKPILSLSKKINSYSDVVSGYRAMEFDLYEIKELIIQKGKYYKELQMDFKKALQRQKALAVKDPESKHNKRLIKKFTNEVNQELPSSIFFIPKD